MTGKPAPMIPVLLFALAAFGHAAEARRVSVAVPDLSASLIAFVVAKEKRFYEAEGLDVELIKMSASLANLALIGGNVAFGAAGAAAIPSVIRGAPLRFLFHTYFGPSIGSTRSPTLVTSELSRIKKSGSQASAVAPICCCASF
jgi:ABC-type nitrate/sulfonate/bicarbonate transport system substrate-binding protein